MRRLNLPYFHLLQGFGKRGNTMSVLEHLGKFFENLIINHMTTQ